MAVIEVEVEVSCACGNPLSATVTKGNDLEVEACEKCVGDSYDEGYSQSEKDNEL